MYDTLTHQPNPMSSIKGASILEPSEPETTTQTKPKVTKTSNFVPRKLTGFPPEPKKNKRTKTRWSKVQYDPSNHLRAKKTGLPEHMLQNLEALSGYDMSDVRVHRNSPLPKQIGAYSYAQGTNIYLGPNRECDLGHEAWHTVQQKQGRVETLQHLTNLHEHSRWNLEREADKRSQAIRYPKTPLISLHTPLQRNTLRSYENPIQHILIKQVNTNGATDTTKITELNALINHLKLNNNANVIVMKIGEALTKVTTNDLNDWITSDSEIKIPQVHNSQAICNALTESMQAHEKTKQFKFMMQEEKIEVGIKKPVIQHTSQMPKKPQQENFDEMQIDPSDQINAEDQPGSDKLKLEQEALTYKNRIEWSGQYDGDTTKERNLLCGPTTILNYYKAIGKEDKVNPNKKKGYDWGMQHHTFVKTESKEGSESKRRSRLTGTDDLRQLLGQRSWNEGCTKTQVTEDKFVNFVNETKWSKDEMIAAMVHHTHKDGSLGMGHYLLIKKVTAIYTEYEVVTLEPKPSQLNGKGKVYIIAKIYYADSLPRDASIRGSWGYIVSPYTNYKEHLYITGRNGKLLYGFGDKGFLYRLSPNNSYKNQKIVK